MDSKLVESYIKLVRDFAELERERDRLKFELASSRFLTPKEHDYNINPWYTTCATT